MQGHVLRVELGTLDANPTGETRLGYHSHKVSKNWGHLLENTKHESRKSDCRMFVEVSCYFNSK